jgi:hypothetical protein
MSNPNTLSLPLPAATEHTIEASLLDGPRSLLDSRRRVRVAAGTEEIKVPHCGGYEHFVRTESRLPGDGPVIFRWSGRTYIAE